MLHISDLGRGENFLQKKDVMTWSGILREVVDYKERTLYYTDILTVAADTTTPPRHNDNEHLVSGYQVSCI